MREEATVQVHIGPKSAFSKYILPAYCPLTRKHVSATEISLLILLINSLQHPRSRSCKRTPKQSSKA